MNKKLLTTIAAFTAVSVTSINIMNKILYKMNNKNISKSPFKSMTYEWRFGNINYIQQGSGSPLLLVHDLLLGSSNYEFHSLINVLSQKYNVYAIDLLGYGFSDKFNMTYTDYLYVQLINDFIKNVIGRKTHIIATGDSASTAIMTCHNNPEIISNIILVNPQSINVMNHAPTKKNRCLKFVIDMPVVGTFIYNIISSKKNIQKYFQDLWILDSAKITSDIVSKYAGAAHYPDYRSKYSYSSFISNFMNTNIVHAIKEINHNIYILYGEQEPNIEETINQYKEFNPAIEAACIDGCKHFPHMEMPDKFLKQLDIFINI